MVVSVKIRKFGNSLGIILNQTLLEHLNAHEDDKLTVEFDKSGFFFEENKMKTNHKIIFGNANKLENIDSQSIDMMITSPPYPMIQMWDKMFSEQNSEIENTLKNHDGNTAFELMHKELDKVWDEVNRVLKVGGIACINIGDATRTVNGTFKIYPNHSRILNYLLTKEFHALPYILWIKETNKPNKFMGSGMLPVGAYVTLEHEYILILRKKGKREFKNFDEKIKRQKSAFFWEERNVWFSDKWKDMNGVFQKLNNKDLRERSAAYPFDLAYRLINMYSIQGDIVLDPFLGTGTTTLVAMVSGRNSIGVEIDSNFRNTINDKIKNIINFSNVYNKKRLESHIKFINTKEKNYFKYHNKNHNFPVMTRQERNILIQNMKCVNKIKENEFEVEYN